MFTGMQRRCLLSGEAQRSVTQVRALAVVTGTDGTCVQGPAPERMARAPPTATVNSRAKSRAPFPEVLSVGGRHRPQPSVIHEDGFSLKTFSKGFPCSVSFAVPATVTKVGDHKCPSCVQAPGQQPWCTAAVRVGTRSRTSSTALFKLRVTEGTNTATLQRIPCHPTLRCRV